MNMLVPKIIVCILAVCAVVGIFVMARKNAAASEREDEEKRRKQKRTAVSRETCHFCGRPCFSDTARVQHLYGEHMVARDWEGIRHSWKHLWKNVAVTIPCCAQCHKEFDHQETVWDVMRMLLTLTLAPIAGACVGAIGWFVFHDAEMAISWTILVAIISLFVFWKIVKYLPRSKFYDMMSRHPDVAALTIKGFRWGGSPGTSVGYEISPGVAYRRKEQVLNGVGIGIAIIAIISLIRAFKNRDAKEISPEEYGRLCGEPSNLNHGTH